MLEMHINTTGALDTYIQINTDASANQYLSQTIIGNAGAVISQALVDTAFPFNHASNTGVQSGFFKITNIPGYTHSFVSSCASGLYLTEAGGYHASITAEINEIHVKASANNFGIGTTITLYGMVG